MVILTRIVIAITILYQPSSSKCWQETSAVLPVIF